MSDLLLVKVTKPAFNSKRWLVRDKYLKYTFRGEVPKRVIELCKEGRPYFYIVKKDHGYPEFIKTAEEQEW